MAYPGYPGYPAGQPYPSPGMPYQTEKPTAHIEGPTHVSCHLHGGKTINQWSQNAPNGHLAGGMTYNNGRLRVPVSGIYMVYCQVYLNPSGARGRFFIKKNQGDLLIVSHATSGTETEGNINSMGLFRLNVGEEIYVEMEQNHNVWMGPGHCFFGAHLV